jgi:ketosteroid isomerase-like protein
MISVADSRDLPPFRGPSEISFGPREHVRSKECHGQRDVVDLYLKAIGSGDLDMVRELQHPDVVARYPQSGEVFRGRDKYMDMQAEYPGLPHAEASNVIGQENVVLMPAFLPFGHPTVTLFGGDQFVVEGVATYPTGEVYNVVIILRLQNGKVIEETVYFAAPFDAPEWRRRYADTQGL